MLVRPAGWLRAGVVLAVTLVLVAAVLSDGARGATEADAQGASRSSARPCSSYPHPGSLAPGPTPVGLTEAYGVLMTPRTAADAVPTATLRTLGASGIVVLDTRYLGTVPPDGRAYMVPAEHLLPITLAPAHCLAPGDRPLQQEMLPKLRRDYSSAAICLVIVSRRHGDTASNCAPAPSNDVDPLRSSAGSPAYGIAPSVVRFVRVELTPTLHRRVTVRRNFWALPPTGQITTACGVSWLSASGTFLRVAASCKPGFDNS